MVSRLHVELGHSDPRGILFEETPTQTHHCCCQTVQLQCLRRKWETKVTSSGCSSSSWTWYVSASWPIRVEASNVEPTRVGNHQGGCWKSCCLRDHPQSHGYWTWIGQRDRWNHAGHTAESLGQILWQTRHCQNRSRRSFSRSRISTWSGCQEHTSRHRSWKSVLENKSAWENSGNNRQQFVWLERFLTVFRFPCFCLARHVSTDLESLDISCRQENSQLSV